MPSGVFQGTSSQAALLHTPRSGRPTWFQGYAGVGARGPEGAGGAWTETLRRRHANRKVLCWVPLFLPGLLQTGNLLNMASKGAWVFYDVLTSYYHLIFCKMKFTNTENMTLLFFPPEKPDNKQRVTCSGL